MVNLLATELRLFEKSSVAALLKKLTIYPTSMKQNFTNKGLARLYFIMRVSVVNLILLVTFCLQVVNASPANGQNVHDTFVSISEEHIPLKKVFKIIESQTNLLFVYPPALLENYDDISLKESHISVNDVLMKALKGSSIAFKESDGNILLFFRGVNKLDDGHSYLVTGKVIEASTGTALPGASIFIKGTTNGVTTDAEGKYTIEARVDDILVFSSVGFKSQEVHVAGRDVIDIQMDDDISSLKEVVINGGYYTTTMDSRVGNIIKISEKEIQNQPVTSPLMAIQGRAAGVDVMPNSGIPGSGISVKIRGQNSLAYNGADPLYVIDGVPVDASPIKSGSSLMAGNYDPLSSLNPSNIESIEILKDADATAIYGSRGANGVVLITTKKADEGNTSADFNIYRGIGELSKKVDLLNTQQYLELRKEAFRNNSNELMTEGNAPDFLVWDTTRYTDWQDVLLGGTSDIMDVQAGVSGGSANTSFRLSGGYHKETTIFSGDFYFQRLNGAFTLNHLSGNKKFRASISANYGVSNNYFFDASSPISDALKLPPNAPNLFNDDGSLNWEPNSLGGSTWTNPLAEYRITNDSKSSNLLFNSVLSYNLTNGLVLKSNFGYNDITSSEVIKRPTTAYDPVYVMYYVPESIFSIASRNSWIIEPQLLFDRQFGIHGLDIVVGATFQEGDSESKRIDASGYASDALLGSLQGASTTRVSRDDVFQYRYTSAFARVGYNLKDKYFLSITGRRDGSSRFGPDNRFGNFGSVGASWIFSKERLIVNNFAFITRGKIRGSAGTTGNDQIGDYRYLNTYSATPNKYYGLVGLLPTNLYNPEYKWEITKKLEAALEIALFKNRISLEIAWYRNRSSNQLTDFQLPGTTGFGSVLRNLDATIENKGWEYILNLAIVENHEFSWNLSANLSNPRNKLTKFSDIENSPYSNTYIVGESINVNRFYEFTGVDSETGLYTFLDVNSDGKINAEDRLIKRNIGRLYFGGINNTISFKNIELSFLFQFVRQNSLAYLPPTVPGQLGSAGNVPLYIYENRWQKGGDITDVQKVSTDFSLFTPYYNNYYSNNSIVSSSFFRLKTLSLSYSLPPNSVARLRLDRLKVYVQGQNLLTVSRFKGLDPETGYTTIPPLRMVSLGLQAGI
jgi:TonB-dependent starch-binding outer membrane protein SusC